AAVVGAAAVVADVRDAIRTEREHVGDLDVRRITRAVVRDRNGIDDGIVGVRGRVADRLGHRQVGLLGRLGDALAVVRAILVVLVDGVDRGGVDLGVGADDLGRDGQGVGDAVGQAADGPDAGAAAVAAGGGIGADEGQPGGQLV